MTKHLSALFVAAASLAAAPAARAQTPVEIALDSETVIGGIGVACTGIGEAKADPRWAAYPVRVEFANSVREYLIGATVSVADAAGKTLLTASCAGPWFLLKLPDRAAYRVEARINSSEAPAQRATVHAPAQGQSRVVLTFPDI